MRFRRVHYQGSEHPDSFRSSLRPEIAIIVQAAVSGIIAATGCGNTESATNPNVDPDHGGVVDAGNDDAALANYDADAPGTNDELDASSPPVGDSTSDSTTDAGGCLAVAAPIFRASRPQAVRATIEPNQDGPALDNLWVEFFGNAPVPGTYAIQGPETNYQSCSLCVTVRTDETRTDSVRFFMATSGTIVIDASSRMNWEFAGSLRQVILVESTTDPRTSVSAPVPGGKCLVLSSADFDTVKAIGSDCIVQQDCGDITQRVCDPVTKKCSTGECIPGVGGSCAGSSEVCLSQTQLSANVDLPNTAGVCYSICTPFDSDAGNSCPTDSVCVIPNGSTDLTSGICVPPGANPADASCDPSTTQLETGCVAGYICVLDVQGYRCRQHCDALAPSQNCPPPLTCRYDTHACE